MTGGTSIVKKSVSLALALWIPLSAAQAQTGGPLVLPGAVSHPAEPAGATPRQPSPARPARPAPPTQTPAPGAPPAAPGVAQPAAPPRAATPAAPLPDNIFGQVFHRNGLPVHEGGRLTITEQQPGVAGLRLQAFGHLISDRAARCAIDLGSDGPAPMLRIEEPYSQSRYRLQSPVCPLVVEVLPHAVRVSIPDGECTFVQADCRLEPEGLWGPDGDELASRTSAIERQRGKAEREMREVSRKLLRRLSGAEQRDAAAEQAAFSSERAMVCRNYKQEDKHGFCAAELTSARVERLNKRFELTPERTTRGR
ncbi:hypothetical protein FHS82_000610 [Pseudochelatococcus lubricantis]|uniref:Uncharacterized protein n=1 Tax=Pseudochelatococcus lubricantis TaxID=1538102 RepID=A0ABX0UV02_9HYPH|nr:hypothetical protein [Pseudochelatococcus lubricantis]NIJ56797.1 hypothetical protein [Pseudochelatococcus lubricantis]